VRQKFTFDWKLEHGTDPGTTQTFIVLTVTGGAVTCQLALDPKSAGQLAGAMLDLAQKLDKKIIIPSPLERGLLS